MHRHGQRPREIETFRDGGESAPTAPSRPPIGPPAVQGQKRFDCVNPARLFSKLFAVLERKGAGSELTRHGYSGFVAFWDKKESWS
jgi:hypothetical protein